MFANWAFFRGVVANMNVAAVATLPYGYAVTFEYDALFEVIEELAVALLVFSLDFADFLK